MCGKKVLRIDDHHVIPWHFSHDDSDSNIMRLCASCHKKADSNFVSLIMYGKMSGDAETRKRAITRYARTYSRAKLLFYLKLLKYTHYADMLMYNTKTENICIWQYWRYVPYKHRGRRIKSRSCLNRLPLAKGQATLSI